MLLPNTVASKLLHEKFKIHKNCNKNMDKIIIKTWIDRRSNHPQFELEQKLRKE